MPDHHAHEPPASALAEGPAKTEDIESTRRNLRKAEQSAARELHARASRHEDDVHDREAEPPRRDPFAR
jgi:hypothetical protein